MFDALARIAGFRRERGPYARGLAELETGRTADAVATFEALARAAPTPAERARAGNKLGACYVALGRRDDALVAFATALAEDERHAPALANVGNLLLEDGAPTDALDYFRAAAVCDPTCVAAERGIGLALRALGDRAGSVRALRTADRLEARRRPERA